MPCRLCKVPLEELIHLEENFPQKSQEELIETWNELEPHLSMFFFNFLYYFHMFTTYVYVVRYLWQKNSYHRCFKNGWSEKEKNPSQSWLNW